MSLREDLKQKKEEGLSSLPKSAGEKLLNDIERVKHTGIEERAPQKGSILKNFTLKNQVDKKVKLSDLRAKGPVAITFYRGGWCPYCNLELRAYQKVLPEIKALGATLVAITPELPDESMNTSEKNNLEFEVLTDINSKYAKEIGIVFTLKEEMRPLYLSFGIDLEKHNGKGQFDLPLAATFVVDKEGKLVFAYASADYTTRAEPTDVVAALKAIE